MFKATTPSDIVLRFIQETDGDQRWVCKTEHVASAEVRHLSGVRASYGSLIIERENFEAARRSMTEASFVVGPIRKGKRVREPKRGGPAPAVAAPESEA